MEKYHLLILRVAKEQLIMQINWKNRLVLMELKSIKVYLLLKNALEP